MFSRWVNSERVLLMLAVVAGVGGFFAARNYLLAADRAVADKYSQRYAPARVLVAATDLEAGSTLQASQLAVRSMPRRFLASSSVAADDVDSVLDARLAAPLKAGDPLQKTLLHSSPASLSTQLPRGVRGLSLTAESLGPVGSLLRAGDRIDLWLDAASTDARLGLQRVADVEVTAVGADPDAPSDDADKSGSGTVTLQVTPSQVRPIVTALRAGGVAAVLRPRAEPPEQIADAAAMTAMSSRGSRAVNRDVAELFLADGLTLTRRLLSAGITP